MMRYTTLVMLGTCLWAHGQDPANPILGPAEFKRLGVYKVPDVEPGKFPVKVVTDKGLPAADKVVIEQRKGEWFVAGDPGYYSFEGWYVQVDKDGKFVGMFPVSRPFRIVGVVPPAPDPTPPGPDPTPPNPDKSPIDVDGLHVLVIFEASEAGKLTRDQHNTIYGQAFYDFLNAKTPEKNGQHTWNIWDKDTVATPDMDPVWNKALALPRTEIPWVVIGTKSKGGYSGPLPKTKAEIMSLVQKFAD